MSGMKPDEIVPTVERVRNYLTTELDETVEIFREVKKSLPTEEKDPYYGGLLIEQNQKQLNDEIESKSSKLERTIGELDKFVQHSDSATFPRSQLEEVVYKMWEMSMELDEIRKNAESIQNDPTSTNQDAVRAVKESITSFIDAVEAARQNVNAAMSEMPSTEELVNAFQEHQRNQFRKGVGPLDEDTDGGEAFDV